MAGRLTTPQFLVLAFFVLALLAVAAILLIAPSVYDQQLRLLPGQSRPLELLFLVALSLFLLLVGIGVLRRWRWIFWLILVAFMAGLLRVPAAILQLTGVVSGGPPWYVALQGVIGLVQVAIALRMLTGYRRGGVWA